MGKKRFGPPNIHRPLCGTDLAYVLLQALSRRPRFIGREPWRRGVQPIGVQQHRQTWYGAVCSLLVLSSCNQSSGVVRITRTEFTAGAEIETTEIAVPGPPSGWRIAALPSVIIGSAAQPQENQLARPVDAIRLGNGRIVVADAGLPALRWYDPSGRHLFDAGRRGEGPGEFKALNWIGRWRGDSLAAYDAGLRRLSVFGLEGSFAWSISLLDVPLLGTMGGLQMLAEGTVLAVTRVPAARQTTGGFERRQASLLAVDLAARDASQFPVVWNGVSYRQEYPSYPGQYLAIPIPFEPVTEYGAGHGLLVVGETSFLRLEAYNARVERLWEVSVELDRRTPTRRQRDWAHRSLEQRASNPMIQRLVRRALQRMEFGSYLPAFGRRAWERPRRAPYPDLDAILIDAGRNVWVLGYVANDRNPRPWMVFSGQGRWLGQVVLPKGFEPFDIGQDYVLGWREERDGAIAVVLYDILKDASRQAN